YAKNFWSDFLSRIGSNSECRVSARSSDANAKNWDAACNSRVSRQTGLWPETAVARVDRKWRKQTCHSGGWEGPHPTARSRGPAFRYRNGAIENDGRTIPARVSVPHGCKFRH